MLSGIFVMVIMVIATVLCTHVVYTNAHIQHRHTTRGERRDLGVTYRVLCEARAPMPTIDVVALKSSAQRTLAEHINQKEMV